VEKTKNLLLMVCAFCPDQRAVLLTISLPNVQSVTRHHIGMSSSLLEIKAVLDEVLKLIDDRRREPNRVLRRASDAILALEHHQDDPLPGELEYQFFSLLSSLRANAWNASPEVGIAEIKRFYIALLRAIQVPDQREPDYARNA
jgi:hypothetical protein